MPKKKKVKKTIEVKKEMGGRVKPSSFLTDNDKLHVNNLLKIISRATFSEISMDEIAACMASYARLQMLSVTPEKPSGKL